MTGSDRHDDTTRDHERFEAEQLAQDRDANRVPTDDVDESTARQLVGDLVTQGVVIPVATDCVLGHEPTDAVFDSIRQLAAFHRGWTAARDAGAEDD